MEIVLESEAELPKPSKALRLLSSYLVTETDLSRYLSGRQLFKMTTETITVSQVAYSEKGPEQQSKEVEMELVKFRSLCLEERLVEIYKLICEMRSKLCH